MYGRSRGPANFIGSNVHTGCIVSSVRFEGGMNSLVTVGSDRLLPNIEFGPWLTLPLTRRTRRGPPEFPPVLLLGVGIEKADNSFSPAPVRARHITSIMGV